MTDTYWEEFYKQHTLLMEPSDFSRYCISFIKKYYNQINNLRLLDLGCGNGKDSLYFANNGLNVLGIDRCKLIIDKNKDLCNTNLNFSMGDFVTTKEKADIYYSRFSIHSINEINLDLFLKNTFKKMKNGDIFLIETRSVKDSGENEDKLETNFKGSIGDKHYRILYSLKYLKNKLTNLGFKILNKREDRGLAKFMDEDPYVIRLTCTKYNNKYIDDIKNLLFEIITPHHIASQKHKIHIFAQIIDHLNKFGISYWLCYGTLLGYLRYKNMIPWDDDIDICINIKDIHHLCCSLKNTTYSLTKANEILYRFSIEGIEMDIFVIDFSLNHYNEMKLDEVYPLQKVLFSGIECYIPNKYTEFFKRRYGDYDHLKTCLIWNHKINNYWNKDFVNNKYLITKGDSDKIINEIYSLIDENTQRCANFINNLKIDNKKDLVLSCVFNGGLDMFLSQLSNILTFNKHVIIMYKIKKSLFEEIKLYGVCFPDNVIFNDDFIDENQWDISMNNKLLLYHICNYKYAKNNKINFKYFGLISQHTYFLKAIDLITSYTYFKIDINKNKWKNESIRKDKKIMSYDKLYGGQLDGTIIPSEIFESAFSNIKFEYPLENYPYHEVYIPTLTYEYIKDRPNKYAFCKICWSNEYNTIDLCDIEPLYNKEMFSALYISDLIPFNDPRRIYINLIKESSPFSSLKIMVNIKKQDGFNRKLLIRDIEYNDFNKKYLYLLKQLTDIDLENISMVDFNNLIDKLSENHKIIVIENIDDGLIIGSATLYIKQKFIYNMGKVGHIEDIVIDYKYRECGLEELLIDIVVQLAKDKSCCKVVTNCNSNI